MGRRDEYKWTRYSNIFKGCSCNVSAYCCAISSQLHTNAKVALLDKCLDVLKIEPSATYSPSKASRKRRDENPESADSLVQHGQSFVEHESFLMTL
jgi:hypothetical protein